MVAEARLHVDRIPTVVALVGIDLSEAQALAITAMHAHRASVLLKAA